MSPALRWDHDTILFCIRMYAEVYGDAPTSREWSRADPGGKWPTSSTVRYHFGTWNDAIEAAGYEALGVGQRRDTGIVTSNIDEIERRYIAGETVEELAEDYGCAHQNISFHLREHGTPMRRPGWRPHHLRPPHLQKGTR